MKKLLLLLCLCGGAVFAYCQESPPVDDEEPALSIAEKMPIFPGGVDSLIAYITRNTVYPQQAAMDEVKGRVLVGFIINTTGEVSNAVILQSVSPTLDAEALRVVRGMPNWIPGEEHGEKKRVKFTLPFHFGE